MALMGSLCFAVALTVSEGAGCCLFSAQGLVYTVVIRAIARLKTP